MKPLFMKNGYSNLLLLIIICCSSCCFFNKPDVSIVSQIDFNSTVEFGVKSFVESLENRGISYEVVYSQDVAKGQNVVLLGLNNENQTIKTFLLDNKLSVSEVDESYIIGQTNYENKQTWVICGADDRGLQYGLLHFAEHININGNFCNILNNQKYIKRDPYVKNREVSMYTMNRAHWESRFYDEAYWEKYMSMLAQNRFNTIVLIFGYENAGFLAPCYPYFFNVEGFPDVKMKKISAEEQQKNLAALNKMIEIAHNKGIDFKVGIWDHIYRGGIQDGGITKEELENHNRNYLVENLDAQNLNEYTKAALTKFINLVPELDGIQLRMHNESGLKRGKEMQEFWTDVFKMIKASVPDFQFDLRAKELPEAIIDIANNLDLNFTITTKYWMEQMGLPYHPTHINRENQHERRHGYADMLRYPKKYNMHWRLWSGGTQRILLWGDPNYVRRFAKSTHLYNGTGFEINEPLATKMETQEHDAVPFSLLNEPYVYYEYEFERYWYFFKTFGRLSYNPDLETELLQYEFKNRFGNAAGPIIQEAMHKASQILPRIVASCAPYSKFPTTRGWVEKQRMGNLPEYANAEGSDIQQFASFDTEAKLIVEGGECAKRLPSATSKWFLNRHLEIDSLICLSDKLMIGEENKEYFSTVTDLRILSNLALYHSRRIPAAVNYRIFKNTGEVEALDAAIQGEMQAIGAWNNIVECSSDVYSEDIKMGIGSDKYMDITHHLCGHWEEELGFLRKGLGALISELVSCKRETGKNLIVTCNTGKYESYAKFFETQHKQILNSPVNSDIIIKVSAKAKLGIKWIKLRYRSVNQHLDYESLFFKESSEKGVYEVTVPANKIDPTFDFMYFIELMDNEKNGWIYPDFENTTPYYIVNLTRE